MDDAIALVEGKEMTPQQLLELKPGDSVYWNDPDDEICSRTVKIKHISIIDGEMVRIEADDGSQLECPHDELVSMKNPFSSLRTLNREQLEAAVLAVVGGSIDAIEEGMPHTDATLGSREANTNESGDPFDPLPFEGGIMHATLWSVSILGAQFIDDGVGPGDADAMLGDYFEQMAKWIRWSWENEDIIRQRAESKKGTYHISELFDHYPDAEKMAKQFVSALLDPDH